MLRICQFKHMSYSLNSLRGGGNSYRGLYRGVLWVFLIWVLQGRGKFLYSNQGSASD